jgi:hypothetical protein
MADGVGGSNPHPPDKNTACVSFFSTVPIHDLPNYFVSFRLGDYVVNVGCVGVKINHVVSAAYLWAKPVTAANNLKSLLVWIGAVLKERFVISIIQYFV